jgi:antitoxin HicB
MSHRYRVILEPEADGGYAVWVPALPGCVSQGETREEALTNIREAIQCYLESCLKHGEPIPEEAGLEEATVEVAV